MGKKRLIIRFVFFLQFPDMLRFFIATLHLRLRYDRMVVPVGFGLIRAGVAVVVVVRLLVGVRFRFKLGFRVGIGVKVRGLGFPIGS